LTAAHWVDVDAPEEMRVIHTVVLEPKGPELTAAAAALAATLATAEASATSADDFEQRARNLARGGLDIKVERLDPFVSDGRIAILGAPSLDPDFVKGASPLAPGETSGVVRSHFGWHVIRMIERIPEHRVPLENRRKIFTEEVRAMRAQKDLKSLLDRLETRRRIEYSNGVEETMTEATMMVLGVSPAVAGTPPAP
jgi:peptidyl-prolyl cis-trans isomerase C